MKMGRHKVMTKNIQRKERRQPPQRTTKIPPALPQTSPLRHQKIKKACTAARDQAAAAPPALRLSSPSQPPALPTADPTQQKPQHHPLKWQQRCPPNNRYLIAKKAPSQRPLLLVLLTGPLCPVSLSQQHHRQHQQPQAHQGLLEVFLLGGPSLPQHHPPPTPGLQELLQVINSSLQPCSINTFAQYSKLQHLVWLRKARNLKQYAGT
mmetsp:Transcript_20897/g.58180  ORF Transcript_20897/g.58180 Transcript_20897/m.58180 type:complete len:208 (-) Transcript_20897:761-1384(-)